MAGGIAIRRLIRGEDGVVKVALVDLNTLQDVTDPTGYTILEPDNGVIEDIPTAQHPKSAQVVAGPDEIPPTAKTVAEIRGGGRLDVGDAATGMKGPDRDSPGNFGYRDKPTGLGLASALPGPLGMAGKAVNAGWNANNLAANNAARNYLGLPERSTFANAKGIVSDVGNVVSEKANIGGNDYQIGFGGISEDGKHTQLTPDEARTRSLTMDAPISETGVSERGFGYRAPSSPSAPESGTPGALGRDYEGTATGTKQGLAGRVGDITPAELGTVPDAATPESMRSMPDISAPVSGSVTSSKGLLGQPTLGKPAPDPARFGGPAPSAPTAPTKVGDVIDVPDREEVSSISEQGYSSAKSQKSQPASLAAQPGMSRTAANNFGYKATPADKPSRPGSLASPTAPAAAGMAMTPADASARGVGRTYSAEERAQMAKTLAGELTPGTMKGIAAQNPEALAEAASALGTIDNRVNSTVEQGSVAQATRGSQYNANMTSALKNGTVPAKVTERNYQKFGPIVDQLVDDYVAGKVASPTPSATHYYNPSVANPKWGPAMAPTAQTFGPHTFGTPDKMYQPDPETFGKSWGYDAARNVQDAAGVRQSVEDTYGGRPGKTAGIGGFTGQTKGSVKGNALTGSLGLGGGYVSDVGVSGVSTKDTSMSSNPSPGGETGFGRQSSLRDSISQEAKGGLAGAPDGPKGRESVGGGLKSSPSSLGGRVGSGGFSGGSTTSTSKGDRVGSGGFSSQTSDKPDGRKGQESYGGGSKSSSSSKSSGSASSASSGNSRGGMSSGRGMGGFN